MFVDLTSHSAVHGRLARDPTRPDAYRAEVRRNGIDRSYGVDYRSDGAAINASTPPSPVSSLSVPAELIRGTVDQLTAYFLLEVSRSIAIEYRSPASSTVVRLVNT
jgi:hypothetical protein